MKKRLGIISFFVLIFIAFIIVWNYSYWEGTEDAYTPLIEAPSDYHIPKERGVFDRFENADAMDYLKMPIDEEHQRSLDEYYTNRAYLGAPPSIPHPVKNERSLGGNTCIQCHKKGGFVPKFDAYAPITPHPEMINCRQCHVAEKTTSTFTSFAYSKPEPPKVGEGANNAFPGGPPMIPHQLQMRESCISCHAGPSAPKEIRTTHPNRVNCRQCHLPVTPQQPEINTSNFQRQFDKLYEK
ncbi:cytochrome c3 family protein [Haloflavibacter putidus]|uniref:Cytochrome C n=1 Tax=Haloflavibacter putidus TaxID=2576776 RepID=A0A507ZJG5_9FLAO|nr:nitrate reductase cytochrome c-type subunit [Haloflavibacter putidus]TQD36284.1 cytochrome C [Haloflavibacter putidus]